MKRKGWGQIVNICSVTLNGGWSDFTAYVASKGTLLGLTRAMARSSGKFGIRVNAVSPGAIDPAREGGVGRSARNLRVSCSTIRRSNTAAVPDIAEAILFLISDRARFITGQNLTVDGGWWMH